MIEYPVYKLIHLIGMFTLFLGLGIYLQATPPSGIFSSPKKKGGGMIHGLGLLFILVGGFGMLARLGIHWPWPGWVILKLGAWIFLAAALTVIKRNLLPRFLMFSLLIAAGGFAAWAALWKPLSG